MTNSSVRPAPRAVRMAIGVLLVAGLTTVLAGEVRARVPERQVAVPPVAAGPEEVVRAYVDALDARDIDTAKALSTPDHVKDTDRAEDSWYRNVESIENLDILPLRREGLETSRAARYAEGVFVPVYFDLRQRDESSLQDGRTRWGYVLVRQSPADRWLILDQGPV